MTEYAKDVLVTTDWLVAHLGDGRVVPVEVDEEPGLYEQGHVPGAIALDWRNELQDPVERDLLERDAFEALMESNGVWNDSILVLYGDRSNWFAAYAYWLLKIYGHEEVRMLDGGRQRWVDERLALSMQLPSRPESRYEAEERDESIRAFRDGVLEGLGATGRALVDVRSPQEFYGDLVAPPGYEQEGAQRAGHIPTAQSIPWGSAVRDDGTLRPADELRRLYEAEGVTPEQAVTVYCRIGERSAHTWFVLHELLGYPDVRNYDGSWTEWGNLVEVPIEKGPPA